MDFFFPRRCAVCDCVLAVGQSGCCSRCVGIPEYVQEPRCRKCGKPLEEQGEEFCMDCQGRETSFSYGYGLWVYDSRMQASISRFKYHGRREYAAYYAQQLYRQYGGWMEGVGAQALVPVPIHRARHRERGYNQAEIIARHLGELSDIPVMGQLLERWRNTVPQKELSTRERQRNIHGAFRLNNCTQELNQLPECVILVDDIYTTGCTLEACARVLKEAGVCQIYFLCVCVGKGL